EVPDKNYETVLTFFSFVSILFQILPWIWIKTISSDSVLGFLDFLISITLIFVNNLTSQVT
ncbi:hypothetical protein RhiirA1_485780, partial [Rhizophagus irregularis]